MFYVINNMVFGGDISALPEPTDTIEDVVWELYCSDPTAYKIENGKFVAIKTETEMKAKQLRTRREKECFPIINRGGLWYDKLTDEQKTELSAWYEAWLDAPETGTAPEKPAWLENVAKQGGDTE